MCCTVYCSEIKTEVEEEERMGVLLSRCWFLEISKLELVALVTLWDVVSISFLHLWGIFASVKLSVSQPCKFFFLFFFLFSHLSPCAGQGQATPTLHRCLKMWLKEVIAAPYGSVVMVLTELISGVKDPCAGCFLNLFWIQIFLLKLCMVQCNIVYTAVCTSVKIH